VSLAHPSLASPAWPLRYSCGARLAPAVIGALLSGCGPSQPNTDAARRLLADRGTIGTLAEDTQGRERLPMFGRVRDVTVLRDGNIVVLETRPGRIVVSDPRGRLLVAYSSTGGGPGGLTEPLGADEVSDGSVYVYDRRSGLLNVFAIDTTRVTLLRSVVSVGGAHSQCVTDSEVVLLTARDSGWFAGIAQRSDSARWFGRSPLVLWSDLAQASLGQGEVGCGSALFYSSAFLDTVRAYRDDGSLAWAAGLPGFAKVTLVEGEDGRSLTYVMPPDGYDRVVGLVAAPMGGLVVVTQHDLPSSDAADEYREYFLDDRTGQLRWVDTMPARLMAFGSDYAIYYSEQPFPQLLLSANAISRFAH
jgi:hypothetical protein